MNYPQETVIKLTAMAKRIRLDGLEMAHIAQDKGAHLGGGFSCVEIMAVLYGYVLRLDPQDPEWADRDRFLASKNHCVLAHFPALAEAGFIKKEELPDYIKNGSRLIGYPRNLEIGLEYSGGSLGMAISYGAGIALHAREHGSPLKVYVLMGDGELNEGSIWEAFMSAAQYKLDNLVAIIDRNRLSYDGDTEMVMGLRDLKAKMTSFGWNAIECDGHDVADLLRAFEEIKEGMPNTIIANTIKGKGVSFMENRPEWHHRALTQEQYEIAKKELLEG